MKKGNEPVKRKLSISQFFDLNKKQKTNHSATTNNTTTTTNTGGSVVTSSASTNKVVITSPTTISTITTSSNTNIATNQGQPTHNNGGTKPPPPPVDKGKQLVFSQTNMLSPTTMINDQTRGDYIYTRFREMYGLEKKNLVLPGQVPGYTRKNLSKYFSNPIPNPVSISRSTLFQMNADEYVVSEKTDGIRYSLILLKDSLGSPTAIMMDRSKRKYEIRVCADHSFFEYGSLFDGELAWEREEGTERLVYWVFDAIQIKGESVRDLGYIERFERLHSIFYDPGNYPLLSPELAEQRAGEFALYGGKILALNNPDFICFCPKPSYHIKNIESLWYSIKTLNHRNDGLVFTPIHDPIRTGTHWRQFKWKYENSLDFQLRCKRRVPLMGSASSNNSICSEDVFNDWMFGLYYVSADYTVPTTKLQEEKQKDFTKLASEATMLNACQGVDYAERIVYFIVELNDTLHTILYKLSDKNSFSCVVECVGGFHSVDNTKFICSVKCIRLDKS